MTERHGERAQDSPEQWARSPLHAAVLTIVFVLELVLLVAAAVIGWSVGDIIDGTAASVLLAILLPIVIALVWGVLLSPKAPRRVEDPGNFVLKLVLFVGAAVALVATGHATFGLTVGAVALVTLTVAFVID